MKIYVVIKREDWFGKEKVTLLEAFSSKKEAESRVFTECSLDPESVFSFSYQEVKYGE